MSHWIVLFFILVLIETSSASKLAESHNISPYHSLNIRSNENFLKLGDSEPDDDNEAEIDEDLNQNEDTVTAHWNSKSSFSGSSSSKSTTSRWFTTSVSSTQIMSPTPVSSEIVTSKTIALEVSTTYPTITTAATTSDDSSSRTSKISENPSPKASSSIRSVHLSVIGKPSVWSQPSKMAQLPDRYKLDFNSEASSLSICAMIFTVVAANFITIHVL
ncbi:hypothetical protein K7432_012745 [Basidiobolus ranarum]|uniref:Uncharacterized protein n=1 Tax=Basidiobolus ranarum TaxID=34480 RepID=A0ABR2VRT4_9FUNG